MMPRIGTPTLATVISWHFLESVKLMARLALLPARLGGLGLQCAERVAPAAYWAAWADALPVLRLRRPEAAARCLAELEAGPASFALCLRAAAAAGAHLTHAGWEGGPMWSAIHDGLRPAQCDLPEPGERCQCWQHHGSRACSTRFRDTELLPALAPPAQALLRSQSGPRAAAWLGTVPSEAGATMRMLISVLYQSYIALRRRLRLPLPVAPGRCGAHGPGCGAAVDVYSDHYAACPRTGLLARRAKPLERAGIRVVREAVGPEGQVVPQHRSRALRALAPLRGAATQGWYRRWWGLLSVAVQNTLAATLLGSPPVHAPMPGAQAPPLQDVLHVACPPVPSCLPARVP